MEHIEGIRDVGRCAHSLEQPDSNRTHISWAEALGHHGKEIERAKTKILSCKPAAQLLIWTDNYAHRDVMLPLARILENSDPRRIKGEAKNVP